MKRASSQIGLKCPYCDEELPSHQDLRNHIGSAHRDRVDEFAEKLELDKLIWALGAETSEYPEKFDCCGSSIIKTEKAVLKLAGSVLRAVESHGFNGLVTLCPPCFKMLDGEQKSVQGVIEDQEIELPVVYYTQLSGLALGISPEKVGLNFNQSPVEGLQLHV